MASPYVAPIGNNVVFNAELGIYTAPSGDSILFGYSFSLIVQVSISTGVLTGLKDGVLLSPQLTIQPDLLIGSLETEAIFSLTPKLTVQAQLSIGILTVVILSPQLTIQPSILLGALQATATGIFLAPQLSIMPSIRVGFLSKKSIPRKFAELKVFLDKLRLEEIKVVELFDAGQDIYYLEKLSSREVEKVLVSGEPVSFTRFKDAIRLTEVAAGPVTVIPAKRINSFQLGEAEPIEIFIGTNPVVGYSSFSITSVNTLDNTQGAWKFSLTYDGVPEFTLLSDSVPESLWVFPDVALSTMSYATAVELTAFASLRKK